MDIWKWLQRNDPRGRPYKKPRSFFAGWSRQKSREAGDHTAYAHVPTDVPPEPIDVPEKSWVHFRGGKKSPTGSDGT